MNQSRGAEVESLPIPLRDPLQCQANTEGHSSDLGNTALQTLE